MSITSWRDRITFDPAIHHGEPVIRGTRISVSVIVGSIADGDSFEQLRKSYPQLADDDIRAALQFAAEAVNHVDFLPIPSVP
jgi:uncharacterized protein (DUF433 family)